MSDIRDAAFYRQRAAHMRAQAERAETDQLRTSYLAIAADWERLADQAELAAQGEQASSAMPPWRAKDSDMAEA
jgi:hypothetical protein